MRRVKLSAVPSRGAGARTKKHVSGALIPQDSREDSSGAVQLWGRSREKLRRFRCLDEQPILSHAAATEGSARASARGTLSDAQQQLLVRGSLSGQRPRRSERRRPRTFLSRGAKNTAGCPGMRLEATRGAGEDDPTQQDHCVRESQGNSRVKDHAENSCKPRYAKHETDVEQHSGLIVCETYS